MRSTTADAGLPGAGMLSWQYSGHVARLTKARPRRSDPPQALQAAQLLCSASMRAFTCPAPCLRYVSGRCSSSSLARRFALALSRDQATAGHWALQPAEPQAMQLWTSRHQLSRAEHLCTRGRSWYGLLAKHRHAMQDKQSGSGLGVPHYEQKWLHLDIVQVDSKGRINGKSLGQALVNLADYASDEGRASVSMKVACDQVISSAVGASSKLLLTIG